MVSKVKIAAQLVAKGIDAREKEENYSIHVRLPGELAERVFAIYDLSRSHAEEAGNSMSRNRLIVALIEAGIEAVQMETEGRKR